MGDLLVELFVGFSLIIMGFDLWMVLPINYKWVTHPGQVFCFCKREAVHNGKQNLWW